MLRITLQAIFAEVSPSMLAIIRRHCGGEKRHASQHCPCWPVANTICNVGANFESNTLCSGWWVPHSAVEARGDHDIIQHIQRMWVLILHDGPKAKSLTDANTDVTCLGVRIKPKCVVLVVLQCPVLHRVCHVRSNDRWEPHVRVVCVGRVATAKLCPGVVAGPKHKLVPQTTTTSIADENIRVLAALHLQEQPCPLHVIRRRAATARTVEGLVAEAT
mmetsp:Transcript_20040/g.50462  ORF Transcript_20040/g.50462 Transcript_20040/m.50462 type:complete len:218 (-) Transcript_20040:14-667(-)